MIYHQDWTKAYLHSVKGRIVFTGGVGYDNKNNQVMKKIAKRGDRELTSELGFEAGIPSFGNVSCNARWKRNDLNLKLEKRYDGDCQWRINITMPLQVFA